MNVSGAGVEEESCGLACWDRLVLLLDKLEAVRAGLKDRDSEGPIP
jgi:hypothetical protein